MRVTQGGGTPEESGLASVMPAPAGGGRRNRRWRGRPARVVVLALTVAIVASTAYVLARPPATDVTRVSLTGSAAGDPPRVGIVAPPLVASDALGAQLDLRALVGHPVWLTFGASWCQSCRAENPDVEAAWRRHARGGLVLVAVFLSEDASSVRDYATRVGLTYRLLPDPDTSLARAYRVVGLPTHLFIDAQGVIRSIRVGSLSPPGMDEALQEIGA